MIAAPSPERQPPAGLTPTEDLFLEVLAARVRLGETCWTFGSEHTRTARSLATKGLIYWQGGVVEHTIRAFLTDAGRTVCLSPTYKAPPTTPKRVQMSRQHPWRADNPAAVIVARPSQWGNPYTLDRYRADYPDADDHELRFMATSDYRGLVEGRWDQFDDALPDRPSLHSIRTRLRGRDLACW